MMNATTKTNGVTDLFKKLANGIVSDRPATKTRIKGGFIDKEAINQVQDRVTVKSFHGEDIEVSRKEIAPPIQSTVETIDGRIEALNNCVPVIIKGVWIGYRVM